ncbi:MAG: DUF2975 domain-containing protein, partial [Clostridia bacterium]|nr:DUF2975 domain-containing protein [Clostridia bacterium]
GILVCMLLPFAMKAIAPYYDRFRQFYWQAMILYLINGILAILLINELRKVFKTVIDDDCFVVENVISLNKMGNFSFMIAAISLIRLFVYITIAILVVILVFVIAGLFSKVLSGVFAKAVTYKLENNLTI